MESSTYRLYGLTPEDGDLSLLIQVFLHIEDDIKTWEGRLASLLEMQRICQHIIQRDGKNPMLKEETLGWSLLGLSIAAKIDRIMAKIGDSLELSSEE